MRPFQTAVLVTVLVMAGGLGLFVTARKMLGPGSLTVPKILESIGATLEQPAVLVLIVRDRNELDQIQRAIAPDRIIASSRDAFAVVEGRIVTTRIEAAGVVLSQAGWVDRELEFLDTPDLRRLRMAGAESGTSQPDAGDAPPTAAPEEPADLSDLYAKDTLTVGEALRVLKHGP